MPISRSASTLVVAIATSLALVIPGGCKNADPTEETSTTAKQNEHGSHMSPPQVKVSQLTRSGPGPEVGDEWTAWVALNVCGQFLEPVEGEMVRGITAHADGTVTIAPTTAADAGHNAVIESYIRSVGAKLESGSLTLPTAIAPPEIEVRGTKVALAGTEFTDGEQCGDVTGKVAIWVYSPEAVRTGNGLVTVFEDPQQVPFFSDGMAVVVTFTPESSLPTLPPAAAVSANKPSGG